MQEEQHKQNKLNLLIGLSGSVAVQCADEYISLLKQSNKFNIKIILTSKAQEFIDLLFDKNIYYPDIYDSEQNQENLYTDQNEIQSWKKPGDIVPHLYLKDWAHIFLIAPLTANSMAKISNGLADNLLSCVARAWEFQTFEQNIQFEFQQQKINLLKKPFIVAPAMNPAMYNHPITAKQINIMKKFGIIVMDTQKGLLASQLNKEQESMNSHNQKNQSGGGLASADSINKLLYTIYDLLQLQQQ